jgi:cation-transporting ATPase 13A3/4/5
LGHEAKIIKHFDFDHHRMTQSVIVQDKNGKLTAFVKGSGESLQKLCRAQTLPRNFDHVLRESAKKGIYQISMASKSISTDVDLTTITRDEVEADLHFEGVVNFKNVIREETPGVIAHLEEGGVTSIMITGDSVLTGVAIARESGIIKSDKNVLIGSLSDSNKLLWRNESNQEVDFESVKSPSMATIELAISASAWTELQVVDPALAKEIVDTIKVYGRCTPYDKVDIVNNFVRAGYTTMMCGDGGNDCGALKTAHVGVALSDAEASIVAPFTSLDKEIGAVVEVLLEGRCALASAMASYKYILMYGMVETINQLINAYFLITFSQWGWVLMDGIWIVTLSIAIPLAQAAKRLSPTRPTASVLGLQTLTSFIGVLLINFTFTVVALFYLFGQDWFQCRKVRVLMVLMVEFTIAILQVLNEH